MKSIKQSLNTLVNDTDTKRGKYFALTMQTLILISLVSFSVSTLPDLSISTQDFLRKLEVLTVVIFSVEYITRVYVARTKLSFIFSFFGIVDLFAVLPFYISTGLDLRSLRLFRLLRVLRVLKMVRYNKAMMVFHRALIIAKEELILFMVMVLIMLYVSAVGIYYFEHTAQPEGFKSIFHSLWWAVATLTTVGYGDAYPITAGGRIFTFFILMIGLGTVAIPSGIISAALTKTTEEFKHNKKDN